MTKVPCLEYDSPNARVSMDLLSGCDGYIGSQKGGEVRVSQSSFILVLAILMVPVIAIYVTFFSVGSGFGGQD